jgi:hypothetical protein
MACTIILIIKLLKTGLQFLPVSEHPVSVIKTNLSVLFKELVGVYSENSTEHIYLIHCDKMFSFKY